MDRFKTAAFLVGTVLAAAAAGIVTAWLIRFSFVTIPFFREHDLSLSALIGAAFAVSIWLLFRYLREKRIAELRRMLWQVDTFGRSHRYDRFDFDEASDAEVSHANYLRNFRDRDGTEEQSRIIPASIDLDLAHFSITAPLALPIRGQCELCFWVHRDSQRDTVLERAKQVIGVRDSSDLLFKSEGPFNLERGTLLSVAMRIEGLLINPKHKTVLWTGEIGTAAFVVSVPKEAKEGTHRGVASVRINNSEIAKIHFVLVVTHKTKESTPTAIALDFRHHKRAFASYASADRQQVVARVQGMESAWKGLSVFMDTMDLRAGQHWEEQLWNAISQSDVFYLFWCRHALKSAWVEREWRFALEKRGLDFIDPVPLESPKYAPPPPELAVKHFDDPWLVYISSAGHSQQEGPGESD